MLECLTNLCMIDRLPAKFRTRSGNVIVFVRHARTDWNTTGRLQGNRNTVLSRESIRVCRDLSTEIQVSDLTCYASDRSRAISTANLLGFAKVHTTPLLRERSLGKLEGFKKEYIDRTIGYSNLDSGSQRYGVESDHSVSFRARRFVKQIYSKKRELVVAFSHGRFMECAIRLPFRVTEPHLQKINNLCCFSMHFDGARFTLSGQYEHLGQALKDLSNAS